MCLERDIQEAWMRLLTCAGQLDMLDLERTNLLQQQQEAELAAQRIKAASDAAQVDAPIVHSLKNAQIEACHGQTVPSFSDAVALDASTVHTLNSAICEYGGDALAKLKACSELRRDARFTTWTIGMHDLQGQHEAEHVRELQLLHVSRDVAKLWDPRTTHTAEPLDKHYERLMTHNKHTHVRTSPFML